MQKSMLREIGAFVPDEPERMVVEWQTAKDETRSAQVEIKHLSFADMEKLEAGTPGFLMRLVLACVMFDGEHLTQEEVANLDPRFAKSLVRKAIEVQGGEEDDPNG